MKTGQSSEKDIALVDPKFHHSCISLGWAERWHQQTDTTTNIVTYRLNVPMGRFSESWHFGSIRGENTHFENTHNRRVYREICERTNQSKSTKLYLTKQNYLLQVCVGLVRDKYI